MMHVFSFKIGHRYRRRLLVAILGFLIAFSVSLLPTHLGRAAATAGKPIAQNASADASANSFLQAGIQFYESEQFAAAIDSWDQALRGFENRSEPLNQALLLSNLSLAHQRLGQWPQANETIAKSLSLLETSVGLSPVDLSTYTETLAKALNTQGRLHWARGDMEAALLSWQDATAAYRQASNERGILLSLLNQAKALQTLGLHLQSKAILEDDVAQLLQNETLDPVLKAKGFWHLGNAQRQLGNLQDSQGNLQQSLAMATAANLAPLQSSIRLDLGNTERALSASASAIGKRDEALAHRQAALKAYQAVASADPASMRQVQANLNWLSLLVDSEAWSEANGLWPDLLSTITQLPPSRAAIYAQLNFAKSLATLRQTAEAHSTDRSDDQGAAPRWQAIDAILVRATQQAQALNDPIAESYGMGQQGELYERIKQWDQAQALTQKALWLTNKTQYLNGRYRWEWQQGRLLKAQGKQEEAIKAYDAAVNTLDKVRKNLLFIDAEVQFSFRDNVEPIYRELVELILSTANATDPSQENLDKAIRQIDHLQLSELENFLRCDLSQTATISQFKADATTAILYPMILDERLTVILQLPETQKTFSAVDVSRAEVEETLQRLRQDLSKEPSRTPEVIEAAQAVYTWLIEPLEATLTQHEQIDTLVFVLDGALRNIPMGVLHDGSQYLIEKYAIAIAPELELFTPRPLPKDLTVFTGGVGNLQQIGDRRFPAIAKLADELDKISELFGPQPPLTNENFQPAALEQQLSTGKFSGIHIKTHGVFSSDPEETFIVAHEQLIRGEALGNLIQAASRQGETPIELLVLSACSTATSDSRAVLGLAGIAVRSGARSTLSTLWEAQDTPNTELMIRFYEELKQPDTTRAQALQKAQLALINQGYQTPHIWATYVLVGNWR